MVHDALPEKPLEEVADLLMGTSPPGSTYNENGNGLPLINGPAEYGPRYPVPVKWTTAPSRICKPGDVLICVRGNTTGRMNISDGNYCIGRGVAAVTAKPGISDSAFLQHVLTRLAPRILEAATGGGTTFPNINKPQLARLPLPHLPLPEQRAIAAVLDAADAAIERTRAAVAAARRVKRGLMQQFFEAGLGRVSCADSPNAKLANGWRLVQTGKLLLGEPKNGLSPNTESAPPGFITFSIAAVRDGRIDLLNRDHWKYARISADEADPYRLNRGDLLIVRGNANPDLVGKCGIVEEMPADCIYPDILKRVHFDTGPDGIDPRFAEIAWNHGVVHNQILKRAKTSNGTLKVNSRDVKQVVMPVPPRAEQERLVATVRAAENLERSLAATLAAHERLKRGLMQVLLTGRVRVPLGVAN